MKKVIVYNYFDFGQILQIGQLKGLSYSIYQCTAEPFGFIKSVWDKSRVWVGVLPGETGVPCLTSLTTA